MARDKNRENDHFQSFITTKTKSHEGRVNKLKLGQIKPDRIKTVKLSMVMNLMHKLVAKYSAGLPINSLTEDFATILELIEESWAEGSRKLVGARGVILDQYVIDAQTDLLRLLSIGFLIRTQNDFFQRLGEIIRNDNVVDLIFEFILAAKLGFWEAKAEADSYKFELYAKLKNATQQKNKKDAEKLVKDFLEKDWIKEQKRAQMLTEPEKDWYYGRWSFESEAIVAIMDLDDSSFRDNEYYPRDLVDYYRTN